MSKRSSDDLDNDHTDELPVLLESVTFEDADEGEALFAPSRADDTSEQTALYRTVDGPGRATPAAPTDLAEHQARVADLEAQSESLAERNHELEIQLAQKDQLIGELRREVATFRASANDTSAAERRLATQLAVRDARIAELTTTVEHLQRDAAASAAEVERLRTSAEKAQHEAESLKGELAARPPRTSRHSTRSSCSRRRPRSRPTSLRAGAGGKRPKPSKSVSRRKSARCSMSSRPAPNGSATRKPLRSVSRAVL